MYVTSTRNAGSKSERTLFRKIDKFLICYEKTKNNIIKRKKEYANEGLWYQEMQSEYNADINPPEGSSWKNYIRNTLIRLIRLNVNSLYKILYKMKQTKSLKYRLSKIIQNPYYFIENDGHLLTFNQAEWINDHYGLDISIDIRCEKWIQNFVLNPPPKASGCFWIKTHLLKKELETFCNENDEPLKKKIIEKMCVHKYFNAIEYTSTEYLYTLEKNLGDNMIELFYNIDEEDTKKYGNCTKNRNDLIKKYERNNDISFTSEQKEAIQNSLNNKFNVVTGYPGTGKTTIINCIKNILYDTKYDMNICLTAPTGRAVKNLRDKCKVKNEKIVGTIHKLIYDIFPKINAAQDNWDENEDEDLSDMKPDIIIVDETSMVDTFIFKEILFWCKTFNCGLLLVGDIEQLPSIGPGNILSQIIATKIFNVDKLHKIKRQNRGRLVKNIRQMKKKVLQQNNFDNETMIFNTYKEFISHDGDICIKKLKTFISNNNLNVLNCHFIAPEHRGNFGVIKINNVLQNVYNPNGKPIEGVSPEYTFRDGDRLVRTINDYQSGDFFVNGDICTIIRDRNYKDNKEVNILYDDGRKETKTVTELYEEFALFYCGTIHKSQGCQYENVILFVVDCSSWKYSGDSKKLLYTGISRAVKKCFIIGDIDLFVRAQENKIKVRNSTFLEEFIKFDIKR